VYIPLLMFAKSDLWFRESVNCPPERLFAGLSNKTVNLEDHRQNTEQVVSGFASFQNPFCYISVSQD